MKLYGFGPTRSLRALWGLKELAADFEFIPVNLLAGEHKHPDFLRLNPAGKFPVLVDGDIVIPESAAIVLYLADKYREKKLLPASVGERARSIAGSCSPTLENQQAHGALSTPTLTRDGALRR